MTLIFDMDGTIVDSMTQLAALGAELIAQHYSLSVNESVAAYERTVGVSYIDQLDSLFPDKRALNKMVAGVYWGRHAKLAPQFPLAPGVEGALRFSRDRGHRLFLTSSTSYLIVAKMRQVQRLPFLEIPIDARTKLMAAQDISIRYSAEPIVFFGDTDHDGLVAASINAQFIRVTPDTTAAKIHRLLGEQ